MTAEELVQSKIEQIANKEILTNSQMSEYIKPLAEYAKGCEHITEMGVAIVCKPWCGLRLYANGSFLPRADR